MQKCLMDFILNAVYLIISKKAIYWPEVCCVPFVRSDFTRKLCCHSQLFPMSKLMLIYIIIQQ